MQPGAMEQFALSRQEYKNNKVRKQEKWYDWTPLEGQDALDELVKKTKARRPIDPVPFDILSRSVTPYDKRHEMDMDNSTISEAYEKTQEIAADLKSKVSFKTTSIFGGVQQIPGDPGKGWRADFGYKAPAPAEAARNEKTNKKYASSSFPSKYDEFCQKEYVRMGRKARGL